ncbi:MAG: hypothetical protein PUF51_05345 [Bifidobacteriaceae bacterium]|nr:hypothetical protein [Bifidobacteriaceae bacterium]
MRTSDNGGIDYAIRRISDGKYFVDYGIDPADHDWTWVDDPELSTAFPTAKQAAAACVTYGFAATDDASAPEGANVTDTAMTDTDASDGQASTADPRPAAGYEIATVEWSGDDPIASFEDLALSTQAYVLQRTSDGKYAVDWGEGEAPCGWTDNHDLAVQSGFPTEDALRDVAEHFGFATSEGFKDGYAMRTLDWEAPGSAE